MSRWTDTLFDHYRQVGDPPADAVIQHIVANDSVSEVNRLMGTLVHNDDLPHEQLPDVVVDYLEDTFFLPVWTDPQHLRSATALFNLQGPEIMMLLFMASLPVLYAKQHGAPVLTITRHLSDVTTFRRRIVETAQFLMDVTDFQAFTDSGRGIRTVQKVRLMHAAVRHYIQHDSQWQAEWQPGWGIPINQSDLAGTMLSFSVTVIDGLEKAGVRVASSDKEGYMHLWRLVGHLLGVMPEMIPEDYADAQTMMQKWMARYHGRSEQGVLLMQTLIAFMHERVPGKRFDSFVTNWMRFWLGNKLADALDVPPRDWNMFLVHFQRWLWMLQGRFEVMSPLVLWFTRRSSRRLLLTLIDMHRDGKEKDFEIPERLQAQWGLK